MNDQSNSSAVQSRDEATKTTSGCASSCGASHEPTAQKRKLPLWAILLAVGGFAIFNIIFIGYATSVSTQEAGKDEKYWTP